MKSIAIVALALSIAAGGCQTPAIVNNQQGHAADSGLPKDDCLDINTASADQLTLLDGVGEVTATRIVEYRERHGRFQRPQDVIIVEGFSETKYRAINDQICVK